MTLTTNPKLTLHHHHHTRPHISPARSPRTKNRLRNKMTSTKKIPHGLYLIGCGPGDPELLTSAADSVLKSADVLISDSLIYDSFKNRYENIIKRPRWQDELNKLILKHLSLGHTVARLKVGDVTLYARTKMESSLAVRTILPVLRIVRLVNVSL